MRSADYQVCSFEYAAFSLGKADLAVCATVGNCSVSVHTPALNQVRNGRTSRIFPRLSVVLLAWIFVSGSAFTAPTLLRLPAIDGEFSGDYVAPHSGFKFHWRIAVDSPVGIARVRRARIEVAGHGAHAVVRAALDIASGVTHWKIESASADLAEFFPVLAARFFPDFSYLDVTGKLALAGAGDVSADGGISGNVVAEISEASIRDSVRDWSAEGVAMRVELPALPSLKTAGKEKQAISIRRFTHGASGIVLEHVLTAASLDDKARIHVAPMTARALGGAVSLDAFDADITAPSLTSVVHVDDIESAQLARFLPDAISEVHGRFAGALTLHWTPDAGVTLGNGQLALQKSAGSTLRFAPSPGFFTSDMDSRLYVLPPSWGFLRRLVSMKNPAYETLKQIENGEQPVAVESIAIYFTPEGDSAGRSANVTIAAKPANPKSAIKNLRINVNVTGPLVKVLEMGASNQLKISF